MIIPPALMLFPSFCLLVVPLIPIPRANLSCWFPHPFLFPQIFASQLYKDFRGGTLKVSPRSWRRPWRMNPSSPGESGGRVPVHGIPLAPPDTKQGFARRGCVWWARRDSR